MRMLAVYHKAEKLAYISHLDIQRTLQRAFRRAGLPLAYSQGFNPHPQLSFASAVATGAASDCEWFDVELAEDVSPADFLTRVNAALPDGMCVTDAEAAPEGFGSLSSKTRAAEYRVELTFETPVAEEKLRAALDGLLAGEIIVNKRTKSGIKPVDIRPQIQKVFVEEIGDAKCVLRILGKLQADGGLRAELFTGALLDRLDAHGSCKSTRTAMYFDSDGLLPRLPSD